MGCLDPRCDLCRQAPHRRCISNFAPKYLSGDNLKAKCGAPIRIEVIDQYTGETVPADKLNDLHLEVGLTFPRTKNKAQELLSPLDMCDFYHMSTGIMRLSTATVLAQHQASCSQ